MEIFVMISFKHFQNTVSYNCNKLVLLVSGVTNLARESTVIYVKDLCERFYL